MFGLQTLSCLHDIPVIRSSTDKLQDVYAKAKNTSPLIRLPCNLVETVADKSLKVALTVANPFVKPISGPVRALDHYAVQKLRQMETRYPVINTRPEDVVSSFNEKTEPVRNAMNSVKDTTTSTLQQGKETVSNVASGVADSVFSFCGSRSSATGNRPSSRSQGLTGLVSSVVEPLLANTYGTVQSSLLWFRMLVVFSLLKVKQVNEFVLNKVQHKSYVPALPQRLLITLGAVLDYVVAQVKPDDRTLAELKKSRQQTRLSQQQQQSYSNRQSFKPNPPVTTRQNVVIVQQGTTITRSADSNQYTPSRPDYSNLTDTEELHARLANGQLRPSAYSVDPVYTTEPVDVEANGDIAQLHARINPTDVELLYSRLPADIIPVVDDDQPLTSDQQQLHARIIADELENQGYDVDN